MSKSSRSAIALERSSDAACKVRFFLEPLSLFVCRRGVCVCVPDLPQKRKIARSLQRQTRAKRLWDFNLNRGRKKCPYSTRRCGTFASYSLSPITIILFHFSKPQKYSNHISFKIIKIMHAHACEEFFSC